MVSRLEFSNKKSRKKILNRRKRIQEDTPNRNKIPVGIIVIAIALAFFSKMLNTFPRVTKHNHTPHCT